MNNGNKHKGHATLTLLTSIIIFFTIMITLLSTGIMLLILIQTNIIWRLPPTPIKLLIFMILISTVIGGFTTIIISRLSASPVNMLIQQINRLASGDFHARLHFSDLVSRYSTFSELETSFNKMAEELENTEMLRGDFINNFSHEFKTPIVSIAGFAGLLRKGNLTPTQQDEYLEIIEEESMRLSSMATNVLNLSRVENLSILTDVSTFNLSEQLRSCILLFENKWEQKNLTFNLDFDEYEITANEELLKQVWINLIDNAIKFSPEGGQITFRILHDAGNLSVIISNPGPTIPEESLEKIFNKFYQSDESHASEGNGIGLAIVKQVTELHNGEISVSSKNGYTTFIVKLPETQ